MKFLAATVLLASVAGVAAQVYPTCDTTTYDQTTGYQYSLEACGTGCFNPCDATYSRVMKGIVWPTCSSTGQITYTRTQPAQCGCYSAGVNWCIYDDQCFDPNNGETCTTDGVVYPTEAPTDPPTDAPTDTPAPTDTQAPTTTGF